MKRTIVIRTIVASVFLVVITVGFFLTGGIGTLSAFGWSDISLICPLGALSAMIASKLVIPRAVISLVIAVMLILLFGRFFCGWICPVPLLQRLKRVFSRKAGSEKIRLEKATAEPVDGLSIQAKESPSCSHDCAACRGKLSTVDARHFVLGGALLSTLIFGFPIFCLICPIGLTFTMILLLILLFTGGDVTWSLVFVPVVLVAELFIFKKWCLSLCPLSAFMSLIAKGNRTFHPIIDDSKCLETSEGKTCGACGTVCSEGINLRHPDLTSAAMNECIRCRACADICPNDAISFPVVAKKKDNEILKGKFEGED